MNSCSHFSLQNLNISLFGQRGSLKTTPRVSKQRKRRINSSSPLFWTKQNIRTSQLKSWRHFPHEKSLMIGWCMRGKRSSKLITSPSTSKNNYTLSTEDKNHMSRALSRTMKLPNAEKPFQCNVCEKQVRVNESSRRIVNLLEHQTTSFYLMSNF